MQEAVIPLGGMSFLVKKSMERKVNTLLHSRPLVGRA